MLKISGLGPINHETKWLIYYKPSMKPVKKKFQSLLKVKKNNLLTALSTI